MEAASTKKRTGKEIPIVIMASILENAKDSNNVFLYPFN